jgi:hypothetical protein
MEYHLKNLRTGESYALDPRRTLIGNAEHADVRTSDDGPYLATLVVRYPSGWAWVAHGLSNDPSVTLNDMPLGADHRFDLQGGDVLAVGDDRFRVVAATDSFADTESLSEPPGTCFATVRGPDGLEECRAVDHDLLIGRLAACHVRFPDKRLPRLGALLAMHHDRWYAVPLSRGPIARNRKAVTGLLPLEDGDELQVGPVMIHIEIRPPDAPNLPARYHPADDPVPGPAVPAIPAEISDTPESVATRPPDQAVIRVAAQRLDNWLRKQVPAAPARGGVGGWLESQRARLNRFWYDTPETTAARGHRSAGRVAEAFEVLDRALRARPESPELLRELYRLYESVGLVDLCYRPLRQIEKLAAAQGRTDTWVMEALARLFERMGREKPGMFNRAVEYWQKLESATGVSYARERAAAMANRALVQGGFSRSVGDES